MESYYSCPVCDALLAVGPLSREGADALVCGGCPYCGAKFEALDELAYDIAANDEGEQWQY